MSRQHARALMLMGHDASIAEARMNPRQRLNSYSSLSTTLRSTRDARHAGRQLATSATVVIVAITKAIVIVSVGCTPNSRDAIRRFTASAPARPMATPHAV